MPKDIEDENSIKCRTDMGASVLQKSSIMKVKGASVAVLISLFYSLVYMGNGAFTSYVGLYYSSINLSNSQIGLVTSISAAVALLMQPIWGSLSDRARYKNNVLLVCLAMAVGSIWLMPLSGNRLILLAATTGIFFTFQTAIKPLSDTITLELADEGNFKFSKIRTVGSLGYAIMAGIAGKIFASGIDRIFLVFSIMTFGALLLAIFIPPVKGHQNKKKRVNPIQIFKDKKLTYIYIYSFIVETTLGFFYAFHAVYSKEVGISTELIGVGIMVGSLSQFPFMIFFDKIYKKFGIVNILLFSGAIHAIRWLLYSTALTSNTIILIWVMHGMCYIVFYMCLAQYVGSNVIKELKASGQMMNAILVSGLSKIVGGSLGGLLADAFGLKYTFFINFLVTTAVVVGFLIVVRTSPLFKRRKGG